MYSFISIDGYTSFIKKMILIFFVENIVLNKLLLLILVFIFLIMLFLMLNMHF